MDLKTFAEDDFDPKKWINRAWNTSGNQEKEVFVANTVSRLQIYMKQLTNSLDETTTQIVNSIPRALQDAASLQLEGALLQQQLARLQDKVRGVEEQTGHSILSLQRIDQLKSRLENAASALREADKWAALATALEDVLEAGVPTEAEGLAALAGQVAALTASLEVLAEAPDYESKRVQLEALYNRLEAALSRGFLAALRAQDKERTSCYVCLYRGMRRLPEAGRCWRRAAAAALAARWQTQGPGGLARLLAGPASASHHLEWLTNVLQSETPLADLVQLYTELLQSLDPTPSKVVSASLKLCSDPEEGINMLADVRADCDKFVAGIRQVLDDHDTGKNRETVPPAVLMDLGRAAYSSLRESLPKYTDLQKQLLLSYLDDTQLQQEDILEQSRAILSVAERCASWLDAAAVRGSGVAGAAARPYLAPAVQAFFAALSALISTHSRRIEAEVTSSRGSAGVLSAACPAALTLERAAAAALEAASRPDPPQPEQPSDPLSDLPSLVGGEARAEPPGAGAGAALRRAAQQLRALARRIVWGPIDMQLDKMPSLGVWSNNDALSSDLPDFALSPQEYITEIGQYLMTLPQHLEMHLSEKQAPLQFLAEICTHTCELYAERILNIRNMDALGTRRCLTDIVYLSSVVEDLGSNVTPALKNLERSLRSASPAASE
ncbi:conserved oligomeric Golgi complex subunit 7 [Choristoneura fumiferana]|uniref:conserved oligomeric Golgi complex subunit 7 n=1 Tax=Choristoneura fumiferana TaxID=7141 RepID=UPI003D15CD22